MQKIEPITIDLGLPSGTLWADRNLGAESVTDYGDYYMWGSTEPDTDKVCYWAHAPFNGGFVLPNTDMFETFRNEAFPDGVLLDQYDAAHFQLVGNWHMPTNEQFQELIDYTDSEWISVGGINGRRFTSKTNGESIFIPAAGYRSGSCVLYVGSRVRLWGSALCSSSTYYAYHLHFYSGNCYVDYHNCDYGFIIRPVFREI